MKNLFYFIVLLFLISNTACQEATTESDSATDRETILLFQENADDWSESGVAEWTFENGEIIGESQDSAGFLITKEAYENFVLELEFYPDSTVNSGVFIRCESDSMNAETCDEINIWDLHPNQENRTGAVVTKAEPLTKVSTLNQWNTYRIRSEGEQVQAWINDTMTVDHRETELTAGLIGLQAGGEGTIKFRNVQLTPLE